MAVRICVETERRTGLCRQREATQGQVRSGDVRLNTPA
jgi:hypothetical protein